jgi:hypothetical protein
MEIILILVLIIQIKDHVKMKVLAIGIMNVKIILAICGTGMRELAGLQDVTMIIAGIMWIVLKTAKMQWAGVDVMVI